MSNRASEYSPFLRRHQKIEELVRPWRRVYYDGSRAYKFDSEKKRWVRASEYDVEKLAR